MTVASDCPKELWPPGFDYSAAFLTASEEESLLRIFKDLPFRPFNFQGFTAKRRVVEYGLEYDFTSRQASEAAPLPDFLRELQIRAAAWADLAPDLIREAIITEYPAGAPIGWHRDVPQFEDVMGISLASACRMRFKPLKAGKIVPLTLAPRSIYIMRGPARWQYQHSIPPVPALRYSITFRTLRQKRAKLSA